LKDRVLFKNLLDDRRFDGLVAFLPEWRFVLLEKFAEMGFLLC